jgi:hypothetical protein
MAAIYKLVWTDQIISKFSTIPLADQRHEVDALHGHLHVTMDKTATRIP